MENIILLPEHKHWSYENIDWAYLSVYVYEWIRVYLSVCESIL